MNRRHGNAPCPSRWRWLSVCLCLSVNLCFSVLLIACAALLASWWIGCVDWLCALCTHQTGPSCSTRRWWHPRSPLSLSMRADMTWKNHLQPLRAATTRPLPPSRLVKSRNPFLSPLPHETRAQGPSLSDVAAGTGWPPSSFVGRPTLCATPSPVGVNFEHYVDSLPYSRPIRAEGEETTRKEEREREIRD
jgi:hypothetical protein